MASTKKQIFLSIVMLAGAAGITALLYLNRPATEIKEPQYRPVTVDVAEVVKENLRIQVQAQGTVTALRESSLLAEVKGRIIEVSPAFNAGGFVAAGDLLLRIDPRDYETSVRRAQAAVKSAESNLAQEKGRSEVALREWQNLPGETQRSEEAKALYLRKPQLEYAQAQLLAAQADLQTARDNLERTIIRSPYDAIIRAKHSDLGQFVSPGTPLADIFSVDYAEVRLPIPQGKLQYLDLPDMRSDSEGPAIDLYTDTGGEVRHWIAQLHRTEGVFDERSRVLHAVARIEDPYGLRDAARRPLRIGTFVNAGIEGREIGAIVSLPRYVLRAGNFVWVVDEKNRLRNRHVKILRTGGDTIYVSDGLDEGELVSLTTLDSSYDSAEVRIQSRTPTNMMDPHGVPRQPAPAGSEATAALEGSSEEPGG
ncbi:MAG: efflux RND transporter periplasmic adaptor subunit [Halioglobus sp.]|nr:efflux RND transporter periplasmic adaptor subunit [Halioglobus sp.]